MADFRDAYNGQFPGTDMERRQAATEAAYFREEQEFLKARFETFKPKGTTVMAKHTPGPYFVEQDGAGPYICANGHGRLATIECQSWARNGGPTDWENARFIAKSMNCHDTLLEACRSMLHRFGHLDSDEGKREACESARAAIAKAEGKQSD